MANDQMGNGVPRPQFKWPHMVMVWVSHGSSSYTLEYILKFLMLFRGNLGLFYHLPNKD